MCETSLKTASIEYRFVFPVKSITKSIIELNFSAQGQYIAIAWREFLSVVNSAGMAGVCSSHPDVHSVTMLREATHTAKTKRGLILEKSSGLSISQIPQMLLTAWWHRPGASGEAALRELVRGGNAATECIRMMELLELDIKL